MLENSFVSLAVVVPKRQLKSRHLFQANDSCKPVISFYSISAAHICSQRLIYKPGWPRTSQLGASCSTLATAAIRVVSVSGLKTNPSHSSCLKCLYDESVQLVLLSIGCRRCSWSYVRLISTAAAAMAYLPQLSKVSSDRCVYYTTSTCNDPGNRTSQSGVSHKAFHGAPRN